MQRLLTPAARLYGWLAMRRLAQNAAYRSRLPVICVGNFTAGGTGKTPMTIHLAHLLAERGEEPVILTRGYGGRVSGPHWVDTSSDRAAEVGDEPLLLAKAAPTLVARNRREGAIAIERSRPDATAIIMDDGLQNPALAKDLSIAIVDARRGLGNGLVIPAGPLRAPLEMQLALVDAVLVNQPTTTVAPDDDETPGSRLLKTLRRDFPGPVLTFATGAAGDHGWVEGAKVLAYAGIANPQRFFDLVTQLGGQIVETMVFKDHHAFSERDAAALLARTAELGTRLVTTQKDLARLRGSGSKLRQLAEASAVIAVGPAFDAANAQRLGELISSALTTGGYRSRFPQP